jgi:hypothetical protein
VVKPPRKTNTPSEVVGSASAVAGVFCRKKPFCAAPADERARVFWVTTARTTTCWPTSGDGKLAPSVASVTGPCTSPIGRMPCTATLSVQVAVCGVPSSLVAVMVTAYVPAGTWTPTVMVATAAPPGVVAGVKAVRSIVPVDGAGETPVMATSTTVPSASVAVTSWLAAVPAIVVNGPAQVITGWLWAPMPSRVLFGKPSHSMAGSKGSAPSVSPAAMCALRRIVLSAVLAAPVPHSVPGSNPIWPITSTRAPPLRRATASSPFQFATAGASWSAPATSAGSASARDTTKTSPSATVPVRATVWLGAATPLL